MVPLTPFDSSFQFFCTSFSFNFFILFRRKNNYKNVSRHLAGCGVHTCDLSTWEAEEHGDEFETNLGYTVSLSLTV